MLTCMPASQCGAGETSATQRIRCHRDLTGGAPSTGDDPGFAALVCTGSADPWSNDAVTAEIIAHLKRPQPLLIDGAGTCPTWKPSANSTRRCAHSSGHMRQPEA